MSCAPYQSLVGKYSEPDNSLSFEFYKDSSFVYKFHAFHTNENSSGRWKQKDKKNFFLNSNNKGITSEFIIITERTDELVKTFGLSIDIKSNLAAAKYKCAIFLNDTLYSYKYDNRLETTGLVLDTDNNNNNLIYNHCIPTNYLHSLIVDSKVKSIFLIIIKPTQKDNNFITKINLNLLTIFNLFKTNTFRRCLASSKRMICSLEANDNATFGIRKHLRISLRQSTKSLHHSLSSSSASISDGGHAPPNAAASVG